MLCTGGTQDGLDRTHKEIKPLPGVRCLSTKQESYRNLISWLRGMLVFSIPSAGLLPSLRKKKPWSVGDGQYPFSHREPLVMLAVSCFPRPAQPARCSLQARCVVSWHPCAEPCCASLVYSCSPCWGCEKSDRFGWWQGWIPAQRCGQ